MLRSHGAMGCRFTDDWEGGRVTLQFAKKVNDAPRTVRVQLDAGDNEKQAYRALFYWLKSQFEAVDFGLLSFEDIFLSYFEFMLPDGKMGTVGDIVKERLASQESKWLLEEPSDEDAVDGEVREI